MTSLLDSLRDRLARRRPILKRYKNGLELELVAWFEDLRRNGWYVSSEIETQDWCIDSIGRDWTILDAGAHIGYYSMLFSTSAPEGRVFAFEASEAAAAKFEENIRHNTGRGLALGNVELLRTALGSESATGREETLYFSGQGPDDGRVQATFDFTTIDDFVEQRGLDRVDLIKTDVDGWDFDVLLGARRTIERFRPVLLSEVNYALGWRGRSAGDVLALLDEIGYEHVVLDEASPCNWLMRPRTA